MMSSREYAASYSRTLRQIFSMLNPLLVLMFQFLEAPAAHWRTHVLQISAKPCIMWYNYGIDYRVVNCGKSQREEQKIAS